MRWAATFELDKKVKKCAEKLQDHQLLAKLSLGYLISQEAHYHIHCLANLNNRVSALSSKAKSSDDLDVHSLALAELICYIEDSCIDTQVAPVFKLSDFVKLYSTRLKQLGCDTVRYVHPTKLKDKILSYFQDMEAHKKGRDVMLIFNSDIGCALTNACEYDSDTDAICLARAAKKVRT